MTDDSEHHDREIERRERLVEIFLIIGGFFAASSYCESVATSSMLLFLQFMLAMLLYYVFLSRTKMSMLINWLAFFASISYSILLVRFINTYLGTALDGALFLLSLVAFTALFTFALAYPDTSEQITRRITSYLEGKGKENSQFFRTVSLVIFVILVILVIIELLLLYR